MPEFILDTHDAYQDWRALDTFTKAYVECIFFTEMEHGTDSETHEPENHSSLPGDMTFADLAPESLKEIIADCEAFQEDHARLLERAYERNGYSAESAGHDYWLTRNGHGAGFWDRGLGSIGDDLTRAAKCDGSRDAYLGDDGKVYVQ